MSSSADATTLVTASRAGDRSAADALFSLLYEQLHSLAHRQLSRGRPGDTLDTTELVHELYLKLMRGSQLEWADRGHFLAVSARAMRQLIVDRARRHAAAVHGGHLQLSSMDPDALAAAMRSSELLDLDRALDRLGCLDPRLCQAVELSYFVGQTIDEIADVMATSPRTVKRDLSKARAMLQLMLGDEPMEDGGAATSRV